MGTSMEQDQRFSSLSIIDHPMIQHKLTIMRDKKTDTITFRTLLKEVALLMGFEITRDFPITLKETETPLVKAELPVIAGKKVAVVPILRAGLGMAEGLLGLIPTARVGHIGLYRDPETKRPVEYLVKLPNPGGRMFILVDPMLATGHSAVYAMDILNKRGVKDSNILFMTLVSCPEGVQVVQEAHPKVKIYTAALDSHLNDKAYIVPGLGDAGDRLFGTR